MLCLVTDRASTRGPLESSVEAAVAAGVDWVQVRARELEGAALLDHADALLAAARRGARARGGSVRVLLNRRCDVVLAAGLDGVHLGFDGLPVARARALLGPAAWIGVSCHAASELAAARAAGADYALLAPVFAPLSKPAERRALGTAALEAAADAELPVLAQGGVSPQNAAACLAAGAAGVAVTGWVLGSDDPGAAAAALRRALDAARGRATADRNPQA